MADGFTRPVETVDSALAGAWTRRATKIAARDQRERDMLSALHDVETYADQIARDDRSITALLDERIAARAQQAEAVAAG